MGFTSYSGPASSFPGMNTWVSNWVDLFNIFKPEMLSTGDTGPDVGSIFNAIGQAASSIGVDERVILCIIMQESSGDVGVRTTTAPDGSQSAGLMQCAGSPGFPGQHGLPQVRYVTALGRHFPTILHSAVVERYHRHDYGRNATL